MWVLPVVVALAGSLLPAQTASGVVSTVRTGGGELNVRTGPATSHARVAGLADGSRVDVSCEVPGQLVIGAVRRTPTWNRLANGRYVSDAYVAWTPGRPSVPRCAARSANIRATVNSLGTPLNARTGPGTSFDVVTTLPHGANLVVNCQVSGQYIIGSVSRTAVWDQLGNGNYVSDANVTWSPARPTNLKTCGQAPPTAPPSVPSSQATFIANAAEPAKASAREFRVPASVTIAQAILESGWGNSQLTRDDHNYFGIKCFGTPGSIAVGCHTYDTHECDSNGNCYPTKASFRVYRNATDSFRDHGRFLVVNERYKPAFAYSNNPDRFAVEIHRAGYATSPTYADNLIGLMRQYNLYRYDIVLP